MRLVATLTTGYTTQLACEPETLAKTPIRDLAELMDHELRWVETVGGAWIRREAIIALHLEQDAAT